MGIVVIDSKTNYNTAEAYGDIEPPKSFMRIVHVEDKLWTHDTINDKHGKMGFNSINSTKSKVKKVLHSQ